MLPPITMHGRVAVASVSESTLAAVADHESMRRLADELQDVDADAVVLSFGEVRALNSAMIGGVLGLVRRLTTPQRRLLLTDMSTDVRGTFRQTRLDTLLDIRPTTQDALRELAV